MKVLIQGLAVGLLLLVVAGQSVAQEAKGFRADLLGQIQYAQKEIMDLEDAIPEAKMTWRPEKGVRSVSEVYLHIAHSNYLFGKFAGLTLPEGVSVASESDANAWDKSTTNKKEISEKLAKSFDFIKDGIKNMSDAALENSVSFFGQPMTVRGVLMAELAHMHEHLGQSIAYARTNHIVPPWTAAELAAKKDKKN